LRRVRHFPRENDGARARAEDGAPAGREPLDGLLPGRQLEELPQRRRLPSRDDEPLRFEDFIGLARFERIDPDALERRAVGFEVALEGEDGDGG
jgi:hypothetical protein